MDPTPKRNLIRDRRIPPRREIRSKSPGSHPEGNLGWENRMEKKKWRWPWPKKVDLGLRSTLRSWPQSSPPPPTTTTTTTTLTVLWPDGFAAGKNDTKEAIQDTRKLRKERDSRSYLFGRGPNRQAPKGVARISSFYGGRALCEKEKDSSKPPISLTSFRRPKMQPWPERRKEFWTVVWSRGEWKEG